MKEQVTQNVTEFNGETLKVADLLEYINSNNLTDRMDELYLEVLYDDNYGDGAIINIELNFDREETDQERDRRVNEYNKRKEQMEKREREDLLRLKQKYESK